MFDHSIYFSILYLKNVFLIPSLCFFHSYMSWMMMWKEKNSSMISSVLCRKEVKHFEFFVYNYKHKTSICSIIAEHLLMNGLPYKNIQQGYKDTHYLLVKLWHCSEANMFYLLYKNWSVSSKVWKGCVRMVVCW